MRLTSTEKIRFDYEYDKNADRKLKYKLVNDGYGVYEPVYTESLIAEYRGNPFFEALPDPLVTDEEIRNWYYRKCPITPDTSLSTTAQIQQVSALDDMRISLPFVKEMETNFYDSITHAVTARWNFMYNKSSVVYVDDGEEKQVVDFREPLDSDSVHGFTLLGVGGSGKTAAVNLMISRYPQVIYHTFPNGTYTQIVWLKVSVPANSNMSALLTCIAIAIDDALGNNNDPVYEKLISRQKNNPMKAKKLSRVLNTFNVGCLILDEVDNLTRQNVKEDSMDALVQIINDTKIGLNLIGTEDCIGGLFNKSWYLTRRTAAPIIASTYCTMFEPWRELLRIVCQVNWFKDKKYKMSDDVIHAIYSRTNGIIERLMSVWKTIQRLYIIAPENRKPIINTQLINKICDEKNPAATYQSKEALNRLLDEIQVLLPVEGEGSLKKLPPTRKEKAEEQQMAPIMSLDSPMIGIEVLRLAREHLSIENLVYNDVKIIDTVASVCKAKKYSESSTVELCSVVIGRLKKQISDKRY